MGQIWIIQTLLLDALNDMLLKSPTHFDAWRLTIGTGSRPWYAFKKMPSARTLQGRTKATPRRTEPVTKSSLVFTLPLITELLANSE